MKSNRILEELISFGVDPKDLENVEIRRKPSIKTFKESIPQEELNEQKTQTLLKEEIQPENRNTIIQLIGPQGYQGAPGKDGFQGYQGSSGRDGSDGYQGPQGLPGRDGLVGPQGALGRDGYQGAQGFQGHQGFQGEKGEDSLIEGPQGPQGHQGFQGEKGEDSLIEGPQGPQGHQGEKGDPGLDGKDGKDGIAGKPGPQGPQGESGRDGLDGIEGPQGQKGQRGPQGERGLEGPTGKPGKEGPQGPQGEIGPQGFQGERGADGQAPEHEWDQYHLRFKRPDGTWGDWKDFSFLVKKKGGKAEIWGGGGGTLDFIIDGKLISGKRFIKISEDDFEVEVGLEDISLKPKLQNEDGTAYITKVDFRNESFEINPTIRRYYTQKPIYPGSETVSLNGLMLRNGSDFDYTINSTNEITLNSAYVGRLKSHFILAVKYLEGN